MIRPFHLFSPIVALSCALLVNAHAGEINGGNGEVRVIPDEPYGGVVVNQTMTAVGQSFYDQFVAAWREFPLTERYVIAIHEWPSARWGSRIRIEYAQRPVFQAFLHPARANIKSIGAQAAGITYRNTVDSEIQRLFFRDPDLAADEF